MNRTRVFANLVFRFANASAIAEPEVVTLRYLSADEGIPALRANR